MRRAAIKRAVVAAATVSTCVAAVPHATGSAQPAVLPPAFYAVGAPRQDVGAVADAGSVTLLMSNPRQCCSGPAEQSAPNLDRSVVFRQGRSPIGGRAERGDRFGAAVALGDFDGNGLADVAIGSPFEDSRRVRDAGIVHVVHGDPDLAYDTPAVQLHQGLRGVSGKRERGDRFGHSLAVVDLNQDGYDDLAVGVPFEDHAGAQDAGIVHVFLGSRRGITTTSIVARQGRGLLPDAPEPGDRFGWSLGGFPGRDTLAIGVPFEDIGGVRNAGAVQTISARAHIQQYVHLGLEEVVGEPAAGDRFGESVAAYPHFGNDMVEILVGAPNRDVARIADAGMMYRFEMPNIDWESPLEATSWSQDTCRVADRAEPGDRFGAGVALVTNRTWVTSPNESIGSASRAGAVHFLPREPCNTGPQHHQGSSDVPGRNGSGDLMGAAVAASPNGPPVILGVPGEDTGGANASGAVLIAIFDAPGTLSWFRVDQGADGLPGAPQRGARFGSSVAAY